VCLRVIRSDYDTSCMTIIILHCGDNDAPAAAAVYFDSDGHGTTSSPRDTIIIIIIIITNS